MLEITKEPIIKLLHPTARGEEVKILKVKLHKQYDLQPLDAALETFIVVVKFSNDVSFLVIKQTQNI